MKISVIMLTYNREHLVGRAIESVRSQTFRDFEFIVVNNGSTDGSGGIADRHAAEDGRIRVLHRARGNIGSGRNTGLDAAQGEYIAFVDDDDWFEPDFLEFLHRLAIENQADAAICGTNLMHSDCKRVMNAEKALITLMWRKDYNNGFPTKLFRRELFADLRFDEEARYEDIGLMYKILAEAGKVVYHGLPKYMVYRHESNNSLATTKSGALTAEYIDHYRLTYRERRIWLTERFPENAAYWRYFDWSFQISMVNKIVSGNVIDCEAHLREMRNELALNQDEFINCPWIVDFERELLERHIP